MKNFKSCAHTKNSDFSGHKCVYNSISIHVAWFNDLRNKNKQKSPVTSTP